MVLVILTLLVTASGEPVNSYHPDFPPYAHRVVQTEGSHRVEIVFHVRAFNRRKHDVKRDGEVLRIDGRIPLGTDGPDPKREIERLELNFDGQSVPVEPSLFADCFEPNFKAESFVTRLSDEGSAVFVFMQGSDAAGSYEVIWVLRKDGKHSRWSGACPDCSLLDLKYFAPMGE